MTPTMKQWWFGMDAADGRRLAIIRLTAFVFAMALVGRNYWWLVALFYVVYRISITDYFKRAVKTLPRDLKGLRLLISVKWDIRKRVAENRPLHAIFLEKVRAHPRKEAVVEVETGRRLNFEELNRLMNQYANYFQSLGFKSGDVVSLFMENSIDFFAIWLGLSKIGVVSAFINSNLKLEPLSHSIKVAKSRAVITSSVLLPILRNAHKAGILPDDQPVYLTDVNKHDDPNVICLTDLLSGASGSEPDSRGVNFFNVLCYIYTSGTTGNPKPAIIKHFRYYWVAMGSGRAFGLQPTDRIYITMPLYHSAAGMMGIGQTIVKGTTAVIRKKFSASNFWKECIEHDCTASQYIGEICRYLLAQKPSPMDRQHKVRTMWGNGLRMELWDEFVNRFGITRVGELYGSTEGNSNIINLDNHTGACGFFPIHPHLTNLYPIRLVKVDDETGELVRDKNGLCITCRPGMTGEMVGKIKKDDHLLNFDGYVNKEDTQKKVLRDVFEKGDEVFSSGDILHWDELGYLYFKDRRGDTFRWKGENCSTTEVEGILQPEKDVVDITVYGVEIPKMEGRAGMAAIVLGENVDVESFLKSAGQRLSANLPAYAVPIFIRLVKELEATGTYKLRKVELQKQGFDLSKCRGDAIYYWNAVIKGYSRLDEQMYEAIVTGKYARF